MIPIAVDWPLEAVWGTAVGFVAFFVIAVGMIGVTAKSLSIPIYGSYMAFAHFAVESDIVLLETILYVTLALIVIGTSFKMWRLEGVGDI